MDTNQLRTREEVLKDCRAKGISITELARRIGMDRGTVYKTLHLNRPCNYGKMHKAAVLLGIKAGVIVEEQDREHA
jgi:gp16 family phage-associated protein